MSPRIFRAIMSPMEKEHKSKMVENKIIVFCDGSSSGNPGPGGWGSVVVFPKGSRTSEVVEKGASDKHTTNNRMEITAALEALKEIGTTDKEIVIHTDSAYVINGITKWVYGWMARGWQTIDKKDVSNRELWEDLAKHAHGKKIVWQKVSGHSGIPGNERVDEIATAFTFGRPPKLFSGLKKDYSVDVHDINVREELAKAKSRSGAKAYSYLSLVDGEFHIDQTWVECEARVKGTKGAKYRKSLSADDEEAIKKEWNIR